MYTAYSFNDSYRKGKNHETELDNYFRKWYLITVVGRDKERLGMDRIFVDKRQGSRYTVEYKADDTAASTGNAFIETMSVDKTRARGWAYTSCAQLIVYFVPPLRKIYLLDALKLKAKLAEWIARPERKIPNQNGYNTIGVLVPLVELETISFRAPLDYKED